MDTTNISTDIAENLERLARGYRVLAANGHTDGTLGHLSWRDPVGRGLWMKCQEVGLDEVEATDLQLIDWKGKVLEGGGHRHSEWPIHGAIYEARENVNSIGHTHPIHCVLFSATDEPLVGVGHNGGYFSNNVPLFTRTTALIRKMDDARALAETLGGAWAVLMRNHGVTFCGTSIAEAVLHGIAIERACMEQLTLNATGFDWVAKDLDENRDPNAAALYPRLVENMWKYHNRRLDKAEGRS